MLKFCKLDKEAYIPIRSTPFSAGYDLYALEDATITPINGSTLVKTGVSVQIPEGYYGRVAMRSGLAVNEHLAVSAGVIDRDYAGPIGVVVYCTKLFNQNNFPHHGYTIKKGQRFAQLLIEKIYEGQSVVVESDDRLSDHKGFGSTGQ